MMMIKPESKGLNEQSIPQATEEKSITCQVTTRGCTLSEGHNNDPISNDNNNGNNDSS